MRYPWLAACAAMIVVGTTHTSVSAQTPPGPAPAQADATLAAAPDPLTLAALERMGVALRVGTTVQYVVVTAP